MKPVILMYSLLLSSPLWAQQFTEKISKEYTFEKKSTDNTIIVADINGSVKVTGYEGDKIMLEVTRTISAKTDARLEKGKTEVQPGVIDRADTLVFYVHDGCNSFGKSTGHGHGKKWSESDWGYHWDCHNRDCEGIYDYKTDFALRVPFNTHVIASTINEGTVTIENVRGVVVAHNINGSISLKNLMREANASTINGDVDVDYTVNPIKDCRFYSLNGDINAVFQKGLAASLSFESFNGSFYTNIDALEPLPVRVEKSDNGEGIQFKVNGNRYRVGKGGAFLDFETFNGDVYLKEKMN